jgi:hypothetical protein
MSTPRTFDLWISAEHWVKGQWNPIDDVVDIKATLQDGTAWVATVCSYKHVETLRSKWSESGECLRGQYVWASNLILAVDTSRQTIEATLADLLANGEFENALSPSNQRRQSVLNDPSA